MTVILTYNPRHLIRIRYFLRTINHKTHLKRLWNKDNGDWHWLKEKATPIASLNRSIWRLSVPHSASLYAGFVNYYCYPRAIGK